MERHNLKHSDFAVLHPFTSWSTKNWPLKKYKRLTDRFVNDHQLKVIFTGSKADRIPIEKITDNNNNIINLAGEINLLELAYLFSKASLFVGGDTGPMHLAAARRIPVIALMGPTNPSRNGPYGDNNVVIQKNIDCTNCWNKNCDKQNQCMELITVDEVFSATKKFLD